MQQIVSYCAIKKAFLYFIKYVKGEITKLKVTGLQEKPSQVKPMYLIFV